MSPKTPRGAAGRGGSGAERSANPGAAAAPSAPSAGSGGLTRNEKNEEAGAAGTGTSCDTGGGTRVCASRAVTPGAAARNGFVFGEQAERESPHACDFACDDPKEMGGYPVSCWGVELGTRGTRGTSVTGGGTPGLGSRSGGGNEN